MPININKEENLGQKKRHTDIKRKRENPTLRQRINNSKIKGDKALRGLNQLKMAPKMQIK